MTTKLMRNELTFICVQPAIQYFAWQVEVMLENFIQLKLHEPYDIHILWAYNTNESDHKDKLAIIKKLEQKYEGRVGFFYYHDTREYPVNYISSIRPNILKQHFRSYPYLSQVPVFYHDSDIVFTKYPDFFPKLFGNDRNWYVSDTISYIGYNYIKSKGDDVVNLITKIAGIHPDFVAERENQSGGAQYLTKGTDWVFWEKVEKDCERMFKEVTELNNQKKSEDPSYHELQIWTSDMWAVIWNAWLRGYNTNVIPELDFCWATDTVERWDEKYIFHNAGITQDIANTHFFKGNYIGELPFDIDMPDLDISKASSIYFSMIKQLNGRSCLQ